MLYITSTTRDETRTQFDPLWLERANTTGNDSPNIEADRRTFRERTLCVKSICHVHVFSQFLTAFAVPARPRMIVLMPNDAP